MFKRYFYLLLLLVILCSTANATILYVSQDGQGDCSSWTNACDLSVALQNAQYGDEIWIKAGVYRPTTDETDPAASFVVMNGIKLYGGFTGTETSKNNRDWRNNRTILSGDIALNDDYRYNYVYGLPNYILATRSYINGTNSWVVLKVDTGATQDTVIDGVFITAGSMTNVSLEGNASPVLSNIVVGASSGGMHDTICAANISIGSGSPIITNAIISGGGGRAFLGGGIGVCNGGTLKLSNALIYYNFGYGSAIVNHGGRIDIYNSTITENSNFSDSGTIHNFSGTVNMYNSILTGSIVKVEGSVTVKNSIVLGGWPDGENVYTFLPYFIKTPSNVGFPPVFPMNCDYRLSSQSQAINAGNNAYVPSDLTTDLDGKPRIYGDAVDLGAYETQTNPSNSQYKKLTIVLVDNSNNYGKVLFSDGTFCDGYCEKLVSTNSFYSFSVVRYAETYGYKVYGDATCSRQKVLMDQDRTCYVKIAETVRTENAKNVVNAPKFPIYITPPYNHGAMMVYSTNQWIYVSTFTNPYYVTVPSGDGNKTVYIRLYNADMLRWDDYKIVVYLDTKPPIGGVQINNGDATTTSPDVILNLSVVDAEPEDNIYVSISSNKVDWTDWIKYSSTIPYTFSSSTPGTKTVYVKFKDEAGKVSAIYSDSILLIPSNNASIKDMIFISNDAPYTKTTAVTLTINRPSDNYTQMAFSKDGVVWTAYETYKTTKGYTLASPDGQKIVYVKFKDSSGQESPIYYDDIILDRGRPVGVMLINNGDKYTRSSTVTLTINGVDTLSGLSKIMLSENNSTWEEYNFANTIDYSFKNTQQGLKKLYYKLVDNAGNISATLVSSIIFDNVPPQGSILVTQTVSGSNSAILQSKVVEAVYMQVTIRDFTTNMTISDPWEPFTPIRSLYFTPVSGLKRVIVKFRDLAGNETEYVYDYLLKL